MEDRLPVPIYALPVQLDLPFAQTAPAPAAPLMQAGGLSFDPGNPAPVRIKPLPVPKKRSVAPQTRTDARPASPPDPAAARLAACLSLGLRDPAAALASAQGWVKEAGQGAERLRANQCLGWVHAQAGRMAPARDAFATAVAAVPRGGEPAQAALFAMAGNAALGAGDAKTALGWFETALLPGSPLDNRAKGAVEIDRARAAVALNQPAMAAEALDRAHVLAPENAEGWLLSATLARRQDRLAAAQHDIERAAASDPADPAIGLEAGVIAVLAGREAAARKSWVSVLATAPGSPEAKQAQAYLDQLGPAKGTP